MITGLITIIPESYRKLQPDPGDITALLLAQISQQLAQISRQLPNESLPTPLPLLTGKEPINPSTSLVICNYLWFFALALCFTCGLLATLVQQWARQYQQEIQRASVRTRARVRAYLYEGLERYGMDGISNLISLLLHVALVMLYAGFVAFFWDDSQMKFLLMGIFLGSVSLYLGLTVMPIFAHNCPYRTPLTPLFWRIWQLTKPLYLRLLPRRWYKDSEEYFDHGHTPVFDGSLLQARERDALTPSVIQRERDQHALRWLVESFTEQTEFEAFIDLIPLLCDELHHGYRRIFEGLMNENRFDLGGKIIDLLKTCDSGLLHISRRDQRATTCLSAVWSIIHLSFSWERSACLLGQNDPSCQEVSLTSFSPWDTSSEFVRRSSWFDLRTTIFTILSAGDDDDMGHRCSITALLLLKTLLELDELVLSLKTRRISGDAGQIQIIMKEAFDVLCTHYMTWSFSGMGFRFSMEKMACLENLLHRLCEGLFLNSHSRPTWSDNLDQFRSETRETCYIILLEYILSSLPSVTKARGFDGPSQPYRFAQTIDAMWQEIMEMDLRDDVQTRLVAVCVRSTGSVIDLQNVARELQPLCLRQSTLLTDRAIKSVIRSIEYLLDPGGIPSNAEPEATSSSTDIITFPYENEGATDTEDVDTLTITKGSSWLSDRFALVQDVLHHAKTAMGFRQSVETIRISVTTHTTT